MGAPPLFGPHSHSLIPPLAPGPKKKKKNNADWESYDPGNGNPTLDFHIWQMVGSDSIRQQTDFPLWKGPTGNMASSKHLLYLVLRWASHFCLTARSGPHAAIIWVSVGRGEHFGEAHAKKSLHIALSASLDLTSGIRARLCAPFDASAVIKSLIKFMSDLPREPGVGEKERRPAWPAICFQPADVAGGRSWWVSLSRQGCLEAGLGPKKQDL